MDSDLVWVRATVNLPGLSVGAEARVDPSDPYIAERLEGGYLVRLPSADVDAEDLPTPPTDDFVDAEGAPTSGEPDAFAGS